MPQKAPPQPAFVPGIGCQVVPPVQSSSTEDDPPSLRPRQNFGEEQLIRVTPFGWGEKRRQARPFHTISTVEWPLSSEARQKFGPPQVTESESLAELGMIR